MQNYANYKYAKYTFNKLHINYPWLRKKLEKTAFKRNPMALCAK